MNYRKLLSTLLFLLTLLPFVAVVSAQDAGVSVADFALRADSARLMRCAAEHLRLVPRCGQRFARSFGRAWSEPSRIWRERAVHRASRCGADAISEIETL